MTHEETRKVEDLKELILAKAEAEKGYALKNAREEAKNWINEQNSRLEQTINGILADARKRAEEIRRREIMSAEREAEREKLRLQNSLLADGLNRLESALEKLRGRDNYPGILAGLAVEGVNSMPDVEKVFLRLGDSDRDLGESLAVKVSELVSGVEVHFDPSPAPITGGLWLSSEDGRWQSRLDWSVKASEMSDELAERLLLLL